MCGIAGILKFAGSPVEYQEIIALTDELAHRGRDSAVCLVGGLDSLTFSQYRGIAFGHRRLSVIDLSEEAAQPMSTLDKRFTIVYNGELYNFECIRAELHKNGYQFRTGSDTEVVLAAYIVWGTACLSRFNGMFAFGIWDEERKSLFCARDPIGIKPFYFFKDKTGFMFSSESKGLARLRKFALSEEAIAAYFLSMYVPGHLSIFEGIHKLEPGEWITVNSDGEFHREKYWHIPPSNLLDITPEEAALKLQSILDRSVERQLRSDVPVGAFLSGGFDSGMIIASAARNSVRLHTYSAGFDDGNQFNELPIARSMAQRYKTVHRERIVTTDEAIVILDRALSCMSEPVADSAIVPTYCLSQMAADDGVKVLLSGTGGDEVFAGYLRYVGSSRSRRIFNMMPAKLLRSIGSLLPNHSLLAARMKYPALDMVFYTGGCPHLARDFLAGKDKFSDFLKNMATEIYPAASDTSDGLYRNMQFDLSVYVPDLLLMLLDQLTMAHTVEGRVPLLDTELIEASYQLKAKLHASPARSQTRKLMRMMAFGKLDERTFTSRKQGFSGPVATWVAKHKKHFQDQLEAVKGIPVLAENIAIDHYWNESSSTKNPYWTSEVFSLYCFSRWYQTHVK